MQVYGLLTPPPPAPRQQSRDHLTPCTQFAKIIIKGGGAVTQKSSNLYAAVMTDRRPTVAELHGLCDVGVRWRSLGIQLNLAPAKLDAINHENARVEDKLAAMYQLWMDKYPNGNRKDILNALRAIEENDIAVKYEGICKKGNYSAWHMHV